MNAKFTIETLESIFLYVGCARFDWLGGIDGAIPLESLSGQADGLVSVYDVNELPSLGANWDSSIVFMAENKLTYCRLRHIHWSHVSRSVRTIQSVAKSIGLSTGWYERQFAESEAFLELTYTQVNEHGKFIKFPVEQRWQEGLRVHSIYNPQFLFSITKEKQYCLLADNEWIYHERKLHAMPTFLTGLKQSVQSYWRVRVSVDSSFSDLTLLTDATGVKEFWRLRDVPEGRKRRQALLHWVSDHWRANRLDPEVETFVRKHLRGSDTLTQGIFNAKITPSEADTLQARNAVIEREKMRKLKIDRRVRAKALADKVRA